MDLLNKSSHATKTKTNSFDMKVVGFANSLIRFRWMVVAIMLMAAVSAGAGMKNLGFSTDYRVFFSDDNPQLTAFEELQKTYIKDDNIMIVIKPKTGDLFNKKYLDLIRRITEKAWKTPYSTRVDSLSNFQYSYAEGDNLIVRDLIEKDRPLTQQEIATIRNQAATEPQLINNLASPDGTTTGININLTMPQKSITEVPEAMNYVRGIADEIRAEFPEMRVALTGLSALNNAFSEAAQNDMMSLIPIMYGVLLLVMAVLLRSVSGTIATLTVIALSAISALGISGWFGVLLTPPSATAPTIILTIAIADSIHILITMLKEMRSGQSKQEAIIESMRINFMPVFLTSLTTIIGFLSLNFSDAPPFRDLGNITALGVAMAWLFSVFFLPSLMAILPVRVKPEPVKENQGMHKFANFIIRRHRTLFWGVGTLSVILMAFAPRIEFNDRFVEYFDQSVQFRLDTDFAMENLSGIYQMQFSLPAGSSGSISEPDYLQGLENFKTWLEKQDGVVHVATLSNIMARLNQNMHADDPEWYRQPGDRNLAAQYLLLFEMSLPYGLDLNNQISVDKSATRLIVTLENMSTKEARVLQRKAQNWLGQNLPVASSAEASGPFIMFAYISKRNIEGMLKGTATALLIISAILMLALKSFRLGLISLIPNMIPAAMAFGVWSIVVGTVDVAASIVAATSLGIVVDATVHFLSKYLRARKLRGDTVEDAVRYAFSTVGTALWVTTAILVAGFGVLSLSAFQLNKALGELTAITLLLALIADFILLPAILLIVEKKRSPFTETSNEKTNPETLPAE